MTPPAAPSPVAPARPGAPPAPAIAPAVSAAGRIDWRTVFLLLPRRRFTAEELQRAIPGPMSPSVRLSVALNLAVPTLVLAAVFGREGPWIVPAVIVAFVAALAWVGARAWADPSSAVPRHGYWVLPVVAGLVAGGLLRAQGVPRHAAVAVVMLMVIGSLALWFVVLHRHQYVEMRLAELAERERAVEMARRLAAAQLEPHFLFNTLASLQHWVATRDERAAPLLQSLTGYLRATLPMFARPVLALADEAEVVRRYLEVMQARLGARLAFRIDIDPRLAALPLPPGLLLTLVENAVEHGIEPRIGGGMVHVGAACTGDEVVLAVEDGGVGPAPGMQEGLGLANVRERLTLLHGPAARLAITARSAGAGGVSPGSVGCRAEVRLPWPASAAPAPLAGEARSA